VDERRWGGERLREEEEEEAYCATGEKKQLLAVINSNNSCLSDFSSHMLAVCLQTLFFLLSVGVQVFLSDRQRRQYKHCVVVSR
jgi:hypothetical protein